MSKGRVCLAYSGGLGTSTILKWLILEGYECFLADVGRVEGFDAVEKRLSISVLSCNAIYEDRYLLGTALARPVIARAQVRVAEKYSCNLPSHGCTGKGNEYAHQVHFELAFKARSPSIKIIAPWRLPEFCEKFQGRQDLLNQDENLVHCSYEAGILDGPDHTPPKDLWTQTVDPLEAPDKPFDFTVHFEKGLPIKVATPDQEATDSVELFKLLNKIGHDHGVGRIDIVENRWIGLKSRGCYDTPGLAIARLAHVDLEGLVLDSKVRKLRDQFVTVEWSQCLYNGMYFSPEREWLDEAIVSAQKGVNGQVRLRIYKGNVYVLGRSSETSCLYSQEDASMDSLDTFSPMDSTGFIAIQSIRLEKYGAQKAKDGQPLSQS
ncbi:hypothetical protein FPOA_08228 [Fusarium poae]|uniref:Argininosuccinate synthase n=1 Tax=Fusarium poae TaxID=36050 RepID=A0A1B8ANG5_FUSPO|nr:hypothetical protein FPOA_08228 [Fusarium poae]